MPNTVIIGTGSYLPKQKIGSDYFMETDFYTETGELIDKPTDEIISKFVEITEIENRRYVEEGQKNSDIGLIAAQRAIEDAKIDPETLDYIIYASNFGDVNSAGRTSFMPSMSARLKNRLQIKNRNCVNYDMIFGCPGWVEALILAEQLIKAGSAQTILVVGSETLSKVTDPNDRNRMIFADGAGAVVVKATERKDVGILAHLTICDNGPELFYLDSGPGLKPDTDRDQLYIMMQGRKIYEYALKNVPVAIKAAIDKAQLDISDIHKILIHQANAKMDHAMIDRLMKLYGKTDYHHSVAPMTIQQFGNSSVATIPTMLDLIKKGELEGHEFEDEGNVVFASVGAGMNNNAVVYRFH